MTLDIGKIIDSMKLSYSQLRNLLITSIGVIVTVWVVGNKVGGFSSKINQMIEKLDKLENEFVQLRKSNKEDIEKMYAVFNEINESNNQLWNQKFNLLITYGDKNKEMLKALLNIEDDKTNIKNSKTLNDNKFNSKTNKNDTNYNIKATRVK